MFGFYLAILAVSDFYYRNRFSFYMKLWPSDSPCYIAMSAFFISFQQSVFSLLLISCHACVLIAFPFKRQVHKYFMHALPVVWAVVIVELVVAIYLQNINEINIVSSHIFCQSPVLAPGIIVPFVVSFCLVYVSMILAFCACLISGNILIRCQDKTQTKSKAKEILRRKLIRKSISALVINFLSLSSVVVIECLMMTGVHIDDGLLITLTMSIMTLSKLCNPWIYTLHNWIQQKLKKQ